MKRGSWLGSTVFALVAAALFAGCTVRHAGPPVHASGGVYVSSGDYATVYPTSPAPPPIPEYRPPAPGWGYVWVDGYWDWTGYDWTWNNGYWIPQRSGYIYVAPRYVYMEGRPVYYRGYWQGSGGHREYGYGGWRGSPPPTTWRGTPRTTGRPFTTTPTATPPHTVMATATATTTTSR